MFIAEPDKTEAVLIEEVGKRVATDLIVALKDAGALRTVQDTAVIDAQQVAQWVSRPPTDADIAWLHRAIRKSSIPQAIAAIALSFTRPDRPARDDDREPGSQHAGDDLQRAIIESSYFPAMLTDLYAEADDDQIPILDELSVRAGLLWLCGSCGRRNPHWFDSCAVAH